MKYLLAPFVIIGAFVFVCVKAMDMVFRDCDRAFDITHPNWDKERKMTVHQMEGKQ